MSLHCQEGRDRAGPALAPAPGAEAQSVTPTATPGIAPAAAIEKVEPPAEFAITEAEHTQCDDLMEKIRIAPNPPINRDLYGIFMDSIYDCLANWVEAVDHYVTNSSGFSRVVSRLEGEERAYIDRKNPTITLQALRATHPDDELGEKIETFVTGISAKLNAFRAWEQTPDGQRWLTQGNVARAASVGA